MSLITNQPVLLLFDALYEPTTNQTLGLYSANTRTSTYYGATYVLNADGTSTMTLYNAQSSNGLFVLATPVSQGPWRMTGDFTWRLTGASQYLSIAWGDNANRFSVLLEYTLATTSFKVSLDYENQIGEQYRLYTATTTTLPFTSNTRTPFVVQSDSDRYVSLTIGTNTVFNVDIMAIKNANNIFIIPSVLAYFEGIVAVAASVGTAGTTPSCIVYDFTLENVNYFGDHTLVDASFYATDISTEQIYAATYSNLPIATTSQAGIVQLVDNATSTSVLQAPTANALRNAFIALSNTASYGSNTANNATTNITNLLINNYTSRSTSNAPTSAALSNAYGILNNNINTNYSSIINNLLQYKQTRDVTFDNLSTVVPTGLKVICAIEPGAAEIELQVRSTKHQARVRIMRHENEPTDPSIFVDSTKDFPIMFYSYRDGSNNRFFYALLKSTTGILATDVFTFNIYCNKQLLLIIPNYTPPTGVTYQQLEGGLFIGNNKVNVNQNTGTHAFNVNGTIGCSTIVANTYSNLPNASRLDAVNMVNWIGGNVTNYPPGVVRINADWKCDGANQNTNDLYNYGVLPTYAAYDMYLNLKMKIDSNAEYFGNFKTSYTSQKSVWNTAIDTLTTGLDDVASDLLTNINFINTDISTVNNDVSSLSATVTAVNNSNAWTKSGNNAYYNGSGNVGIGSSSPAYKLDVIGNSYISKLGVNINPSAHTSTNGYDLQTIYSYASIQFAVNATDNVAFLWARKSATDAASVFNLVKPAGASNINARLSDGQDFYFDPIRNVGIGTTTPTQRLDVVGQARISTSNNTAFTIRNTSNAGAFVCPEIYFDNTIVANQRASIGMGSNNRNLYFWVNGGDRVTIDGTGNLNMVSGGNVNMFNKGRSDYGFGVAGRATSAGVIGYEVTTCNCLDIIGGGTTVGSRLVEVSDNLAVDNRLSIGTTSASYKLHVGGTNPHIFAGGVYSSNIAEGGRILLNNENFGISAFQFNSNISQNNSLVFHAYDNNNRDFIFAHTLDGMSDDRSKWKQRMIIKGDGNVGIGTGAASNPSYVLHVNGSMKLGGNSSNCFEYPVNYIEQTNNSNALVFSGYGGTGNSIFYNNTSNAFVISSRAVFKSDVANNAERGVIYQHQNGNFIFHLNSQYRQSNKNDIRSFIFGDTVSQYLSLYRTLASFSVPLTSTSSMTATAFVQSSDEKLKENIRKIERVRVNDFVHKCNGYTYNMKADNEKERRLGLIAQEVESIFPEAVVRDTDNNLQLRYPDLIAVLLESVKDLSDRMTRVEEKLKIIN